MFKNTQQYTDIYNELFYSNLLEKKAEFVLYSEGQIIYKITDGIIMHEFVIISDSDFMPYEKCIDLLNKTNIGFISHSIYGLDEKMIAGKRWATNINVLAEMN